MKLNFTKINGAGNDFILIDSNNNIGMNLTSKNVIEICDRRKGIGGDGVLIIEDSADNDYNLTYYNSDGSLGSLCGNGSRCSIYYYLKHLNSTKNEVQFKCNDELYKGQLNENDSVSFLIGKPSYVKLNIPVNIDQMEFMSHFVENGSPHLVVFWNDIRKYYNLDYKNFNFFEFGKKIRYHKEFQPKGLNVNLIDIVDDEYFIRTYERGVEDETYSCGTGSAASGIVCNLVYGVESPINFKTFGEDILQIDFVKKGSEFEKITLTGPVKINYIGSYNF